MIIIAQTVGTSLSDLTVDESVYKTKVANTFESFEYDGADWSNVTPGESLEDYGISFTGTPVANDVISVAQESLSGMWEFSAGKGINQEKLNENFAELQQKSNTNERNINNLANTALLLDGSNLTSSIVEDFQKQTPNIISGDGDIVLTDNSSNFLTLTGNNNNKIILPTISPDEYSHTINLTVQGSAYSLDINTATGGHHLYNSITYPINALRTFNVLYIYNKIDGFWYYSVTQ
jgi:hypothetical protein